jgi:hypothetical protein
MTKTARRQSQTRDGFTFAKYAGSLRWSVHRDSTEQENTLLGHAWPNGSRLKSRSWDWKATDGTTGKSSSRQNAAEAMARHAERSAA